MIVVTQTYAPTGKIYKWSYVGPTFLCLVSHFEIAINSVPAHVASQCEWPMIRHSTTSARMRCGLAIAERQSDLQFPEETTNNFSAIEPPLGVVYIARFSSMEWGRETEHQYQSSNQPCRFYIFLWWMRMAVFLSRSFRSQNQQANHFNCSHALPMVSTAVSNSRCAANVGRPHAPAFGEVSLNPTVVHATSNCCPWWVSGPQ